MEHERSEFKNAANTVEMLQIAWGMDRTGNKQKIIQNGEKPTNLREFVDDCKRRTTKKTAPALRSQAR